MMKTIVQGGRFGDKSMVYNVEPVENQLNDWDPERGFYEDYDIKNYFNDERLETTLRVINSLNVALLMLCICQYNYMFKHGSKKITNRYESKKINAMYYTYLFNRVYSLGLVLYAMYVYCTFEKHICQWHYGCESTESGDLTASAYYYSVYNSECPDLDKLEENYLDNQPGRGAEVDSCGQNNYECCKIDIVCEEYLKENRSYESFNNTINNRLIHPYLGYIPIHITSRGGCGGFNILTLISSYLYNDHWEFLSILINIILIWFIANMIILITVLVNKKLDTWIPLATEETTMRSSV